MQIRIEIDVKPEELRRFLGLPDVAGLQEDVIQFLREKVGAASESFDPASFVRDNLQTLRRSAAWQKIVSTTKMARTSEPPAPPQVPSPPPSAPTKRKPQQRKPGAVPAIKKSAAGARSQKHRTTASSDDAA